MKVIVDSQLPKLLAIILSELGHESIHTINLPNGDESSDTETINYSLENDLIVITKDSDFFHSHILFEKPRKLLFVNTGNIKNRQLLDLFRKNHLLIFTLFNTLNFVELNRDGIVSHD